MFSPCSIYIISAIIHDYCSLNAGLTHRIHYMNDMACLM